MGTVRKVLRVVNWVETKVVDEVTGTVRYEVSVVKIWSVVVKVRIEVVEKTSVSAEVTTDVAN